MTLGPSAHLLSMEGWNRLALAGHLRSKGHAYHVTLVPMGRFLSSELFASCLTFSALRTAGGFALSISLRGLVHLLRRCKALCDFTSTQPLQVSFLLTCIECGKGFGGLDRLLFWWLLSTCLPTGTSMDRYRQRWPQHSRPTVLEKCGRSLCLLRRWR